MSKLTGNEKVEPGALQQMRDQAEEDTRWAAYQNQDLGSHQVGHLQFLAVGPNNTYKEAPGRYPDTHLGIGWRYRFAGFVDIKTGEIVEDGE